MHLGIEGFTWSDLSDHTRLNDLSVAFDTFMSDRDGPLAVGSHQPIVFQQR